jgi:hypothetical protein
MASNLGAIGSGGSFEGFAGADFDAFEKKKWSSNAYTLARRTAKDKLLLVARAVAEDLGEELAGLEIGASDEAPTVANGRSVRAQWVFFTRSAAQRASLKPVLEKTDLSSGKDLFDIAIQHRHACLQLRLDVEGLAVGVEIAAKAKVDRDNAAARLASSRERDRLVALAKTLPGEATIGFEGKRATAIELTPEECHAWVDLFAGDGSFRAEVLIPRSEELLRSARSVGTIAQYATQFLDLLRFFAWAPENDHSQVDEVVEKAKAAVDKPAIFSTGDRVTMLAGLFAGRAGYVAEIDADRGKAKVMVGPVSVSVDLSDLKAG